MAAKSARWKALTGLMEHQRRALLMADRYFDEGSQHAALVQLPTGTGKTGVMAVISTLRAEEKPVLVICPSAALVEQLQFQFSAGMGAFWSKIGAPAKWAPERLEHILPSGVVELAKRIAKAKEGERVVAFSTIQALQQIDDADNFDLLKPLFGTILFDEGHREPASSWSRVVRGFSAPTILFSATPFRNDLKIFNVDLEYVAFLAFSEAVEASLIRDIEIDERAFSGHANFARLAIDTRDRMIKSGRFAATDKMIIRADAESDVAELYDIFRHELRNRDEGVLALHNRFRETDDGKDRKTNEVPPRLSQEPFRFLIHQLMLTEGIDDPNCTMLGLFNPFSTERQLVQQVGRLTRHPGAIGEKVAPAYVFAGQGEGVRDMWRRFQKFDAICREKGRPPIRKDDEMLQKILEAIPDAEYIKGKFRARFDPDADWVVGDIRMPKSAIVYDLNANFRLADFEAEIEAALSEHDRFQTRPSITFGGKAGRAHVTMRLVQSPFLDQAFFPSPNLELTAYAKHGSFLFFYDSAGLWMDEADGIAGRISPNRLHALLPKDSDTTITLISAKNTDVGPMSLRNRVYTGASLEESGMFMGEQHHVIARVTGRYGRRRRALGLTRARVREGDGSIASLDEFATWTDGVAAELKKQPAGAALFSRFASPIETPEDTTPHHLLLDLVEFIGHYEDKNGREVEFDLDAVAFQLERDEEAPPDAPYRFDLVVNGEAKKVFIGWDKDASRYRVYSPALSLLKAKDNARITLTRRLNQRQPFRIVLGDTRLVYAYGKFYSVDLRLGSKTGAGALVLGLVEGASTLRGAKSEKGKFKGTAKTWPLNSVFGLIDRALQKGSRKRVFGAPFSDLVSHDFGPEVADFIGVDDKEVDGRAPRAVLLVAKHKPGEPGVSASHVYDVCGQAAKNLAYMKPDAREIPGDPQIFDRMWKSDGARVARRRVGAGTSADFRRKFALVRGNPRAMREVWLVLGGGILSASVLEASLSANKVKAHVVSFVHLILSLHASCQSVGVNLRIYCAD